MKRIETEIAIAAPAARVWAVLCDFAAYPDWNPFIREIAGQPKKGTQLSVLIVPPGAKGMRFRPRLLVAEPERELRWLGRVLMPGLFDGVHAFRLLPRGSDILFQQSETFTGILTALMPTASYDNVRAGFVAMNEALKKRAEG